MRILLHCPPPWAPSGYGEQAGLLSLALRDLGHDVAVSAYAGVHEDMRTWNDIPILNCGGKEYGNGMIPYNARRWKADAVILLCDSFSIEPGQLKGLRVFNWQPVDCQPLGELDRMWLQMASQAAEIHPVAMSRFGQKMLAEAGYQAAYVPHAVDTSIFHPGDGSAWRHELKIPQDAFLISNVGVNGGRPERKSFTKQLEAFKAFSDKRKDAIFYMHCIPNDNNGVNLIKAAISLGLQKRICFADEELRRADAHSRTYMAGIYQASNLYSGPSMGEGFGVPLIEAQACGTPVVATRASAMTELVPDKCGRLVNGDRHWIYLHNSWWVTPHTQEITRAYDQMYNVMTGPQRKVYSEAALRNASQYSADKLGARWEKILNEA